MAALLLCALAIPALARAGAPRGVVTHHTGAATTGATARAASRSFNDSPPTPGAMLYHDGHIMGGGGTVTVHTVYWNPGGLGLSYPSGYQALIDQFAGDVAADSGTTSNVFASDTQYTDKFTGHIQYNLDFAGPLTDTNSFPVDDLPRDRPGTPTTSCNVGPWLTYCLTDPQIAAELNTYLAAHSLTNGFNNLYVLMLPQHVGVCFGQQNLSGDDVCSTNVFCAYHSWSASTNDPNPGYLYAVEPFFANDDPGCGPGQSPNNNDADVAINTISHELNEAITDPASGGWYDSAGNENGDKCAWGFGTRLGHTASGKFNQIINGDNYFLQREWSNATSGCFQIGAPTIASFSSSHVPVSQTVGITGANFFAADGTLPQVLFNGHAAQTVVVDSPTHLIVTVPSVAGTAGKVTVKAAGGTVVSSQVFGALPTATSVVPTSGAAGDKVVVHGTGFFGATGASFNGVKGTVSNIARDGTSLTATVPAGATDGPITITTPGGTSTDDVEFTVLPKVTSFTPTSAAGGVSVTINGSGFGTAVEVDFGSTVATGADLVSVTPAKIVAKMPTDATTGHIVVVTLDGPSSPSTATFKALPSIASFSPEDGQGDTPAAVTINGTNFTGATSVKFGSNSVSFTVDSALEITVASPPLSASGKISVTTPGGTATSADTYSTSKVTSITPTSGAAGTTVTIMGLGLGSATGVDFPDHSGTVALTALSATSIKVPVPSDASKGALVVHLADGDVSTGVFKPLPKITGISFLPGPSTVQAGGIFAVLGTNLTPTADPPTIKIGSAAATVLDAGPTVIVVGVQDQDLTGFVTVTNAGGTATSAAKVAVIPTITGDPTPNDGAAGDTITITGKTFTGTTSVTFGNNAKGTFTVGSGGLTLTVKVPATATTGPITVTNAGGSTLSDHDFTVDPKVTSFTPASAPIGATITIAGTGFGGATSVNFVGATSNAVSSVTPTSLKVVVPAGAATGQLSVHTPAGDSALSAATFTVSLGVYSISPAVQSYSGVVGITGTGFTGLTATAVRFNGVTVPFTVPDAQHITATLPATGDLTGHVTVTKGTVTVQSPQDFTLLVVSGILPASAAPGGSVTIAGSGFTTATGVAFNGHAATTFNIDSDTQISATVPDGFTGGTGSVAVTISGGAHSAGNLTALQIGGWTPSDAAPGASLAMTGSGFTGVTAVTFGGVSAAFTIDSDTLIHATIPTGVDVPGPGASPQVTIAVTGPGGTASNGPFTIDYAGMMINEIAPDLAGNTGLVELFAGKGGGLDETTLSYTTSGFDGQLLIALPSSVTVQPGDLIVLHLGTAGQNETSKASCTDPACYPGAWDFFSPTQLPFVDLVLSLEGPITFDATPFVVGTGATNPGFVSALQFLESEGSGGWPLCSGVPCDDSTTPTAGEISIDWSSVGTTPTGNTLQRVGDGDPPPFELLPGTIGAPNPSS